ncbi:cytoplasmic polyadenylation element-binding protein 1-like [Diaphorina citri]|uniref:Cytoplasmic polyadenylation element-binding protein 1-like n=1 Tax=Diaphorina citri TaxID=121845 RepID=A0A1S3DM96_DIACI|nr:cytoplasmic polyadenylation element-binding protein 1-like [Diaphorina citri]
MTGLTLNTLNGFSSREDITTSSATSSPWFDSPLLTPMTPQIVRSPFESNSYAIHGSSHSPPFGSHSMESCSPPYLTDEGDYSPYYQTGGSTDYFSYNNAPSHLNLNGSMTDSSNLDNIEDLLASLSLNNTGWTNLHNLANVCALTSPPLAQGIDPYTILAHQYYENLRKHRDLVHQLDTVLSSLMSGGSNGQSNVRANGTAGSVPSPHTSPLNSPRSSGARHSPPSNGGYYGGGGGGQYLHNGDGGGQGGLQSTLDIAARHHRSSANSQIPQKTWEGVLPLRTQFSDEILSNKIFIGGVPWDTPEYLLLTVFSQFGPVKVEWPQGTPESPTAPKGFAYLVYDSYTSAKAMLEHCAFDGTSYYYKIPSKKRGRENHNSMVRNFKDYSYWANGPRRATSVAEWVSHQALHNGGFAYLVYDSYTSAKAMLEHCAFDGTSYYYKIPSKKRGRENHNSMGICYRYFCRSCWLKVHIGEYSQHDPIVRNVRKSPPSSPSGPHSGVSGAGLSSLGSFGSVLSRSSLI